MAASAGGLFLLFAGTNSAGAAAGKTLVELDTDVAPSLDPDGTASADLGFETAYVNTFDTLVNYPTTLKNGVYLPNYQVGQNGFAPSLATSYTHHGRVWVFNLRHNVKSCAGNTFTSADVVYTFARAKSVSGATPTAYFVAHVGGIFNGAALLPGAKPSTKKLDGEVKALGPYQVQFTQDSTDALFPAVLTTWLGAPFDSKAMKAHATATDPWTHTYTATTNAPGFGPYCLTQWVRGSSETFTLNPNFNWGPKPVYTRIVVNQVPADSERLAGVLSGTANIATTLTPSEYQRAASSSNVSILAWNNAANFVSLGINYKYAPFNNLKVGRLLRQAIAYALPYAAIGKQVYFGKFTQASGLFPSDSFGYKPIKQYTTNIAKAKQLMAQAGYPGGKGLPTSKDFTLTYTAERSSTLLPLAGLIRTALAQIGITITLNPLPAVQELSGEESTLSLGSFIRDGSRALVGDVGYSTLLYFAATKVGGLADATNYDSPTVNSLYAKSSTAVGSARTAILDKIQSTIMTDLPLIPIGSVTSQLVVSKGITGWDGNVYDLVFWQYLK